ncbi:MAG: hypothetical protein JWM36_3341 [Hyphomicrobiales bacterium]|nr:hypothetical protein [Hyphomicrobiales bacterium]
MKAIPLALACALLGATALVSAAALAQTSPPATDSSPSTSAPASQGRPGESSAGSSDQGARMQSDWNKGGQRGWRSSGNDEDDRGSWRSGSSRDSDWDDEDDSDETDSRPSRYGRGMASDHSGDDDHGERMGGRDMRGHEGMQGRMGAGLMRMHKRMMMGEMAGGGMHHDNGAHLKLKRGNAEIDISCPTGETVGACVEAVTKLMDKLQSMPQTP